jgi:hypothetical protein
VKKSAFLGATLFGLAALGQAAAHAGLVNAGFETGDLTGWTVTYDHSYENDPFLAPLVVVGEAEPGTYYAFLEGGYLLGDPTNLSQTFFLRQGETCNRLQSPNPRLGR